tara:strand:+ start:334 stop:501 length:168 start_codon:yes stop_codon:yes gene_type:complete
MLHLLVHLVDLEKDLLEVYFLFHLLHLYLGFYKNHHHLNHLQFHYQNLMDHQEAD